MKYLFNALSFNGMRVFLWFLFVGMAGGTALCQPIDGLIAYYSFNGCDAKEDTGSGADGIIMGNATCGCGVLSNGLRFDGNTTVQILGNLDLLFGSDFTISFFILPDPQSNKTMDILSKSESCGIDSTVELRYNPGNREMSLTLSEHADNFVRSSGTLPSNRCYHHIVFVRNNRDHFFYYDGVLKSTVGSVAFVKIKNDGILTIGGGPCQANGEVPFSGVIDELRLYNRALTSFEVKDLYSPIDRITSPDTVLFTGTSMQVRLPVTCATSIQWTPTTGVSNTAIAQPVLSPLSSTTYFVNMDYGFCAATDSIHVTVADSADLDCDKVFFPTGFTPNGDNINDDWGMSNIVFLGEFGSLKVYDRWGGEVFESTDQNTRWDGSVNGKDLMPGQYVYQFIYNCSGQQRRKTGSIAMIR
ncbi:MAG: gliding motility-associated C-terminal domain-containing protein [Saprospiraceae bacterium]|uniref:Gliding motility-associated C-terminal domain-containing protein n=1 Tax=Candidatus Opimibacter skivensis TaxID=2982028 RepID=A0A9D7STB1_9BACT|nr:gliding motility-associated C-terminal domain-containing protein [Candidatus Opimibacter skivensis]